VIGRRQTDIPKHGSLLGYGNKIPTSWQIQLKDKRWRRVYVIQWSNAGTPYIIVRGDRLLLGAYDPATDTKTPMVST